MKSKSIYLIGILLLFCKIADGQLLEEFTQKWENASNYTLEIAQLMPSEKYDFRPTNDVMTFSEQLLHITSNMNWLEHRYLNAKPHSIENFEGIEDKELILKILIEGFENALDAIKNISVEEIEEVVDFFAGPMTKRQIIHLMNDHLTHHRGQLIIYLRLNGIQPPRYIGW